MLFFQSFRSLLPDDVLIKNDRQMHGYFFWKCNEELTNMHLKAQTFSLLSDNSDIQIVPSKVWQIYFKSSNTFKTQKLAVRVFISEPFSRWHRVTEISTVWRKTDWLERRIIIFNHFKCQAGFRTLCLFCQMFCSNLISIVKPDSIDFLFSF